jgi:hypothetical protein
MNARFLAEDRRRARAGQAGRNRRRDRKRRVYHAPRAAVREALGRARAEECPASSSFRSFSMSMGFTGWWSKPTSRASWRSLSIRSRSPRREPTKRGRLPLADAAQSRSRQSSASRSEVTKTAALSSGAAEGRSGVAAEERERVSPQLPGRDPRAFGGPRPGSCRGSGLRAPRPDSAPGGRRGAPWSNRAPGSRRRPPPGPDRSISSISLRADNVCRVVV